MERPRAGSGTAFGGRGESPLRMFYPSPRSSQNLSATLKRIKINGRPKKEKEGKRCEVNQREDEKEREKAGETPKRGSRKKENAKEQSQTKQERT